MVLDAIRRHSSISRPEISRLTGISHPTVISIVEELKRRGLVRYGRKQNSTGGRRPDEVEFCSEYGFIVGVDIGLDFFGVLTNLNGEIIVRQQSEPFKGHPKIEGIEKFVNSLLEENRIQAEKLFGIGIGMSGLITKQGEYVCTYQDPIEFLPVKSVLEEKFKVPVVMENDADAGMIAEAKMGVARGVKNGIYIMNRRGGIGFGILINGEILRGENGFAGENFELIPTEISDSFIEGLLKLIWLFDPKVIILSGEFLKMDEAVMKKVQKQVIASGGLNRNVEIVKAQLGKDGVVLGVVHSVIEKLFSLSMREFLLRG